MLCYVVLCCVVNIRVSSRRSYLFVADRKSAGLYKFAAEALNAKGFKRSGDSVRRRYGNKARFLYSFGCFASWQNYMSLT